MKADEKNVERTALRKIREKTAKTNAVQRQTQQHTAGSGGTQTAQEIEYKEAE